LSDPKTDKVTIQIKLNKSTYTKNESVEVSITHIPNTNIKINILDPQGQIVHTRDIKTDSNGKYQFSFKDTTKSGFYQIKARTKIIQTNAFFKVAGTPEFRIRSPEVFSDDFEDNTLDAWGGTTTSAGCTCATASDQAYLGTYSMKCVTDNDDEIAYAYKNLGSGYQTLFVQVGESECFLKIFQQTVIDKIYTIH